MRNDPELIQNVFKSYFLSVGHPAAQKYTFPEIWTWRFSKKITFRQFLSFWAHIFKVHPSKSVHMDHAEHLSFR